MEFLSDVHERQLSELPKENVQSILVLRPTRDSMRVDLPTPDGPEIKIISLLHTLNCISSVFFMVPHVLNEAGNLNCAMTGKSQRLDVLV